MKAVVAAFNQEKALVGAFSVITNLRMELFEALLYTWQHLQQRVEAADAVAELLLLLLGQRGDERLHAASLQVGHLEGLLGGEVDM